MPETVTTNRKHGGKRKKKKRRISNESVEVTYRCPRCDTEETLSRPGWCTCIICGGDMTPATE